MQIVAFDVGIRNFAYCILEVDDDTKAQSIKKVDVVDLGCAKNNQQAAIDSIIDLLDEIVFQYLDVNKKTIVLIEQQMTAAMKAIQVAINVFFKMTAKYQSMDVTSKYLSAKHKLSLMQKFPGFSMNDVAIVSSKYQQNKKDAVAFGLWLLKEHLKDEDNYNKIMSMKKKDDACDTILMTLYYASL